MSSVHHDESIISDSNNNNNNNSATNNVQNHENHGNGINGVQNGNTCTIRSEVGRAALPHQPTGDTNTFTYEGQQQQQVNEQTTHLTYGCNNNNQLIAPSNSIKCVCACDDDVETGLCSTRRVCDRRAPNALCTSALKADLDNVKFALMLENNNDTNQHSIKRHRRCESASVLGYNGGSQRQESIKLVHRRTMSNITTATFNCHHRNSSVVVVITKESDRPKDCVDLILDHCKVYQSLKVPTLFTCLFYIITKKFPKIIRIIFYIFSPSNFSIIYHLRQ